MSNMKTDRQMVAEAKRIIDGIVSHQKSTDQKLSNFEKQVDALNKAQRLMDDMIDLEIEQIDKILQKVSNDPEPVDVKCLNVIETSPTGSARPCLLTNLPNPQ